MKRFYMRHFGWHERNTMAVLDLYQQKRQDAAQAVRQVRDGDFIIVPTGVG